MIDDECAAKQLSRMENLEKFPKTKATFEELNMAMRSAHSEDIAEKTVSEFVQWGDNSCPTPADLRRALHARYETEEAAKPKTQPVRTGVCRKCNGWGSYGERPNIQFCECPEGPDLKRRHPNWLELANAMPKTMTRVSRDRRWNPDEKADAKALRSACLPLPLGTMEPAIPATPQKTIAELEAELAAQTRQYRKPEETQEIVEELNAELAEWLNQSDEEPE